MKSTRTFTKLLLLLILLTAGPAAAGAAAQDPQPERGVPQDAIADRWEGLLHGAGAAIAASFDLRRDGMEWSGTFSLPAEGIEEMPIAAVEVAGDRVHLTLAPGRTFEGRVAGDSLAGRFDMVGREIGATFGRSGSAVAERLGAAAADARATARPRPLEESGRGGRGDVDPAALDRLVEAAEAAGSHALVVLRDGELVGAWYAGGQEGPIEAMSATKSIVSLAVGRIITTGALDSLDVPVHHFYPEWDEGMKARVTVRHLLNHTSGLHADRTTEAIYASDDFVRHALDSEITSEPGSAFFYNNSAVNLLAGIVGKVAGERMDLFLRNDLFQRLDITDFGWSLDDAGNPHGMSGLQILPADLAKLGQLVLQRGEWEGEQLIDPAWIDRSFRPGSALSDDWSLLWTLLREDGGDGAEVDGVISGIMASGYLGQYLVIDPERRLVAVRMVAQTAGYSPETDGFRDFFRRVQALVAR